MIIIIILSGILAALTTRKNVSAEFEILMDELNWFVQAVFTVDVVLKMLSENIRPWVFFYDSWNNFDFAIVAVSFISAGNLISFNPIFFRLFRLFRVLKLFKQFKRLQVIISAIANCALSVLIIGFVMLIYIIIYSSIGIAIFKRNDPFHFHSYYSAMLTTFQSMTYDNFSNILYVNLYGCDAYAYGGLLNWPCPTPDPKFIASFVYFLFNAVVGGMLLINIFIGLMASAMVDSFLALKKVDDINNAVKHIVTDHHIPLEVVQKFRSIFEFLDLTKSDRICRSELRFGLRLIKRFDLMEASDEVFKDVDRDKNHFVEFDEFLIYMLKLHHLRHLENTFRVPDYSSNNSSPAVKILTAMNQSDVSYKKILAHTSAMMDHAGIGDNHGETIKAFIKTEKKSSVFSKNANNTPPKKKSEPKKIVVQQRSEIYVEDFLDEGDI
jgi:voltage-gated sodium channel